MRSATLAWSTILVAVAWSGALGEAGAGVPAYRSPLAVAVAPDGKTLYVSDKTARCVTVLDAAAGKPSGDIPLAEEPGGLALSADGKTLFVTLRNGHSVAVIDTAARCVVRRIAVGPWPVAVVLAEKAGRLYTCNRGDHSVSAVDLARGAELRRIPVVREPGAAAMTPDGSRLLVTNLLPAGAATDPNLAAEVSLIDTAKLEQIARIKLPPGSTIVPGVAVSPDGKWAYVVHLLGRPKVPITQLERGWVHTCALSILDVAAGGRLATVLLDDLTGGAADPWGVVVSPDGQTLAVSHAGIHEISLVAIGKIHEFLRGHVPADVAAISDGTPDNVWARIRRDRGHIGELANDLAALSIAGAIRRVASGGNGPRGLALSPDGQRIYAANYFSGTIGAIDVMAAKLLGTIAVGPQPPADAARRGEIYFHDARRCFQHWHSCASCHFEGRVDGLTWDFMRDGIGNGKDVISLVGMMETAPYNRRATRSDPRECLRTGVTASHLLVPEPRDVDDLLAYVASLKPEANPDRSAAAETRGKALFERRAGCTGCHPAPLFTDRRMHNVGILSDLEPDGLYDTPSLVECYRTAPYYHDGRAATLREALVDHGRDGRHGNVRSLRPEELEDLLAYLRSL